MSCAVCFCDTLLEQQLCCQDRACEAVLCKDCFGHYMQYCLNNREVPLCVGEGCKEWYLLSDVKAVMGQTNKDHMKTYVNGVLQCTLRQEGSVVDERLASKQLLETLRQERLAFLDSHFTKAIRLVIRVAFTHKMNRIRRKRKEKQETANRRRCMNLICKGFLHSETFTCMLCKTAFCQSCERAKEPVGPHVCDPNDVASIAMLRKMIKCPRCKTAVQRSTGCASMTCALCGTKFDYRTGDFGGHGSMNAPVTLVERDTLSGSYRERTDDNPAVLDALLYFESRKPKAANKTTFTTTLMHIKSGKLSESRGALKLCYQLETYLRRTYRNTCYYQLAQQLETELRKTPINATMLFALAHTAL